MSLGLLYGQDLAVSAWCFKTWNRVPTFINRAFGIFDSQTQQLHGAFIWSEWNGCDMALSLFANKAPTAGMVKTMARFALDTMRVERVTMRVPGNSKLIKHIQRAGGALEATMTRYYGRTDALEHTGLQYVLFAEQIAKLAAYKKEVLH